MVDNRLYNLPYRSRPHNSDQIDPTALSLLGRWLESAPGRQIPEGRPPLQRRRMMAAFLFLHLLFVDEQAIYRVHFQNLGHDSILVLPADPLSAHAAGIGWLSATTELHIRSYARMGLSGLVCRLWIRPESRSRWTTSRRSDLGWDSQQRWRLYLPGHLRDIGCLGGMGMDYPVDSMGFSFGHCSHYRRLVHVWRSGTRDAYLIWDS